MGQALDVRNLAERIRAIEARHTAGSTDQNGFIDRSAREVVPTGWSVIDAAIGGGLPAGLHEWLGVAWPLKNQKPENKRQDLWTPPLCILVHLAWQALQHDPPGPWTIWIGRSCHPYPRVLVRGADRRLLENSLFVRPRDAAARVWAMDLALRSPAVGVVIADGSGFDMAATRRFQMLARGESKWALLARPVEEQDELSAAQTRWVVNTDAKVGTRNAERGMTFPLPSSEFRVSVIRWSVDLLRCKGLRPVTGHGVWLVE